MRARRLMWVAGLLAALGFGAATGCDGATSPERGAAAALDTTLALGDGDAEFDVDGAGSAGSVADGAGVQDGVAGEPCGNKPGQILCDVGLQGYLRNEAMGLATEAAYQEEFSIAAVLAKGSQTYAVIVVGAWW